MILSKMSYYILQIGKQSVS